MPETFWKLRFRLQTFEFLEFSNLPAFASLEFPEGGQATLSEREPVVCKIFGGRPWCSTVPRPRRQERKLETTIALRIASRQKQKAATKARLGALDTAMNFPKSTRQSCGVSLRMLSNIAWRALCGGQLGPYALLSLQVAQNRLTCASHRSQDGPCRPPSGAKSAQNMISIQVVQPKPLQHWQLIASKLGDMLTPGLQKWGPSLTSIELFECCGRTIRRKAAKILGCLSSATLWFPPRPMLHPKGPGNFIG